MELITSLISSSVKGRASETTMRTQQFITKKTNSFAECWAHQHPQQSGVRVHMPVCVGACGGMGFDATKRKGAQHGSPTHGPGTV